MSLKLYFVTCDMLCGGDYNSLKERLRSLNAKQIMATGWALRSTHTATELKDIS